jgi:hypothetical protein
MLLLLGGFKVWRLPGDSSKFYLWVVTYPWINNFTPGNSCASPNYHPASSSTATWQRWRKTRTGTILRSGSDNLLSVIHIPFGVVEEVAVAIKKSIMYRWQVLSCKLNNFLERYKILISLEFVSVLCRSYFQRSSYHLSLLNFSGDIGAVVHVLRPFLGRLTWPRCWGPRSMLMAS